MNKISIFFREYRERSQRRTRLDKVARATKVGQIQ
jgi:hypothetical protein